MKNINPRALKFGMHAFAFALVTLGASATTASAQALVGTFDTGETGTFGISFAQSDGDDVIYGAGHFANGLANIYGYDIDSSTEVLNFASPSIYTLDAAINAGFSPGDPHILGLTTAFPATLVINFVDSTGGNSSNRFAQAGNVVGLSAVNPYATGSEFWLLSTDGATLSLTGPSSGPGSGPDVFGVAQTINTGLSGLIGLSVDPGTGNIWTASATTAYNFSNTGTLLNTIALPSEIGSATGIAYDTTTSDLLISNGTSTIYEVGVPTVPEPKELVLMVAGCALLFLVRSFKKKTLLS